METFFFLPLRLPLYLVFRRPRARLPPPARQQTLGRNVSPPRPSHPPPSLFGSRLLTEPSVIYCFGGGRDHFGVRPAVPQRRPHQCFFSRLIPPIIAGFFFARPFFVLRGEKKQRRTRRSLCLQVFFCAHTIFSRDRCVRTVKCSY